MSKLTMVIGMILAVLGVFCYVFWKQLGAPHPSMTALIPTFVGVPMMVLGWLALAKPELRMHLMHAAVVLSTLGLLASLGRFISVMIRHPNLGPGIIATGLMAVLCGLHVLLSVRSFIAARKAREASAGSSSPL